jgi:hypothetical protein
MAKRVFRDAPQSLRCRAVVRLKDGTTAQCGRYGLLEYQANPAVNERLCEQHAKMKLRGRLTVLSR